MILHLVDRFVESAKLLCHPYLVRLQCTQSIGSNGGEVLHFLCHDTESGAVLTCVCGFDTGIDGEQTQLEEYILHFVVAGTKLLCSTIQCIHIAAQRLKQFVKLLAAGGELRSGIVNAVFNIIVPRGNCVGEVVTVSVAAGEAVNGTFFLCVLTQRCKDLVLSRYSYGDNVGKYIDIYERVYNDNKK